jgi:hypothetical protein
MGNDPRNSDDGEDAPISVEQANRAAKTAAAMGRAPKPQTTAKLGKFDLEEAIATSREGDEPEPNDAPTVAPPPAGPLDPTLDVDEAPIDPALAELLEGAADDEK